MFAAESCFNERDTPQIDLFRCEKKVERYGMLNFYTCRIKHAGSFCCYTCTVYVQKQLKYKKYIDNELLLINVYFKYIEVRNRYRHLTFEACAP